MSLKPPPCTTPPRRWNISGLWVKSTGSPKAKSSSRSERCRVQSNMILLTRSKREAELKDDKAWDFVPRMVLFFVFSTTILLSSPIEQARQPSQKQESLRTYPYVYDNNPEISSPYTMADGTEIVVAVTKDHKFILLPVTVKIDEPLGYREKDWDKIGVLDVDAVDFPTLARTGLHSEIELDYTRRISGLSIAEITESGRPGGSSGEGFMSQEEDIISVLKGDNRLVKTLGLTHPQLAKSLYHIWTIIRLYSHTGRSAGRSIENIDHLLYNKRKIRLLRTGGRGWQDSIFNDEIKGMYQIEFSIDLEKDEQEFLEKKYANLSREQMLDFQKKLSRIYTGEMAMFYIQRYGFYEGHTGYRADPLAIALIFGLISLGEIENAFPQILYQSLFEHFSRENISVGEEK